MALRRSTRRAALLVVPIALGSMGCGASTSESAEADDDSTVTSVDEGSTLVLGVAYTPDTSGEAGAVGQTAPEVPAIEAAANALVDELNASGGLAGHPVEVVFHPFDLSGTFSAAYQSACARFTEDNEVFAATTELVRDDVVILGECLTAQGSLLVFDQAGATLTQAEYDAWRPFVYNPGYVYLDRYGEVVDVAAANDVLGAGARVGIIRLDLDPLERAVEDNIEPAINGAGAEVVAEAILTPVVSADGFGKTAQQMTAAVLQFKEAGVDHVMFVGGSAAGPLVFMNSAEAQQFSPRYLLTSDFNPQFLASNAPTPQLANVAGVGWNPATDVSDATGDGPPGAAACFDTLRAAGIDVATDPNQLLHVCDFFSVIAAMVEQAGSLDPEALASAYEQLDGYQSATTFGVDPVADRTDGVAMVRTFAYDASCECFTYTSPALALG